GPQHPQSASQLRRRTDGDEAREIVVLARVAVAEHPAHGMPAVEDLRPPGLPLHRRDPGGHVVDEVAVDVPPVVEVPGKRPAGGLGDLALTADGALAVSTQLQDVDVRAE